MKKLIFDVECYVNYYLIMFLNVESGKVRYYEKHNDDDSNSDLTLSQCKRIMSKNTLIGFNSLNYDLLMVRASLSGMRNELMKRLSDQIITSGDPHWMTERKVELTPFKFDHIDLKEPAPGVMTSLKIYGGRLNSQKLQDLPIEPSEVISNSQADELRKYCINDLDTTKDLYLAIEKQIGLRSDLSDKYRVDMRSKSDAQIAEAIFRVYLEKEGVKVNKRQTEVKPFKYRVPDWVEFKTPAFQGMLDRVKSCTFETNDKGSVVMPKSLNKAVEYDGAKYKFGIGGLHSQEKAQVVIPTDEQLFGEFDVASMYPSIIIEQELYPLHLGPKFLKVYSDIKDTRLAAKRSGDSVVNNTYKIVLNGSYGKFGSVYSFLYSPELLIQTTITGQLSLLMLIEKMTLAGGKVVSANTDGVNVIYSKADYDDIHSVQFDWELTTGYELEYTPYLATYSRDVNNYIAIKESGIKGKGAYAIGGLMKNPTNNVCVEAVISFLADGADIETHIRSERSANKFLTIRNVTGGAVFRGEQLGKAIRFYHSTDGDLITYKKNGNKVPKSDGCKPLMDISDKLPIDIDYQWYISEAKSILKDLGL